MNFKQKVLALIVFSLPFVETNPFNIPYGTPTFLLIYLYLLLSFITFKQSYSNIIFKKLAFPFHIVYLIMAFMTFYYYDPGSESMGSFLRMLIFLWCFFLFAVQDAILMQKKGQNLVLYFYYSMLFLGILFLFNIDISIDEGGRKEIFGLNSNLLGQMGVISFIIAMNGIIKKTEYQINNIVIYLSFPIFAYMIIGSGSRGAIMSLAGGGLLYFVFYKNMLRRINPAILLLIFTIFFVSIYYISTSEILSKRFINLGDDSRVTELWPAAIDIFRSYPILGSGSARFESEMILRIGVYRPAHNEYLTILTRTGIVGFFFFLLFLKRIYSIVDEWREKAIAPLRISIFFIMLFFLFKGGGVLFTVFLWVILVILSVPPKDSILLIKKNFKAQRKI